MKIIPIASGSDGNLYILKTIDNKYYLIECGIDEKSIRKHLLSRNQLLTNYKGCFVSHIHTDHIRAINYITKYIKVYGNNMLKEKINNPNIVIIKPNESLTNLSFKVMPFEVEHGNVENYGYIFKDRDSTILFATDFQTIHPNLSSIKFTELFVECNWTSDLMNQKLEETKNTVEYLKFERQFNTHCSLDTLIELLSTLDLSECNKITLIHASKDVCNKELALSELKNIYPNIDISFAKNEVI